MEQSNMMMQNGGNGMMPHNMNAMQRPQPGNANQQLHANIVARLNSQKHLLGQGWQSTFDVSQRAARILMM
jgi:hypothetical protein